MRMFSRYSFNKKLLFYFMLRTYVLLLLSLWFSFSLLQMFPPLTVGASLVLAESKGHLDPSYIVNLLVQHSVNEFIFSVPTLVRPISFCFSLIPGV